MKQKPSERIKEMQGITQEQLEFYQGDVGKWIIQYLDEVYEEGQNRQIGMVQIGTKNLHCCICENSCGHGASSSYCEKHRLIY